MEDRRTMVRRAALLATALFAVSCTESAGPERANPSVPSFSYQAAGITLNMNNGALGYRNSNVLIKGFDSSATSVGPIRNGDAIIATFYWFGSTNIIDSVKDVYTDATFTPVGNTYNLVDYVTAGGISMATYVATGIHFDASRGYRLAVRADLHAAVSDGGLKISAWSGVEDVFVAARGAVSHGSASGSTPSSVAAGAVTIGAGSLAYGVSLSNGHVPVTGRPAGFATIGGMGSDGDLQDDGDFMVSAGGGTVNPQWTWDFNQPSTALATVLELRPGGAPPPPTGNLTVNASTAGASLDPDGYTVAVDGGTGQPLGINGTVTFSNLSAGSHTVALSGVAANCTVSNANPQTVTVPGGGSATAAFTVSCAATTGNLTATSSTSGSSLDPDGYTVAVDGGTGQALAINGSVTFSDLTAGNHTVALSGVAANCTVSGANPQTVNVPAGGTATATFAVTCVTPPGNLAVTTTTTGSSLDPDGYTVSVDGGAGRAVATNGSVTLTNLPAGNHSVQLSGVAGNCTVSGANPRTISVPSGATTTTTFAVTCNSPPVVNAGPDETALTGLLYSLSVNFSDVDGNGPWSYTIEWGDGYKTSGTRTSQGTFTVGHTYNIILPRSFVIRVTVKDAAGAAGSDTKVVRVLLL